MIERIVRYSAIAMCAAAAWGCASQSADDTLPPPHLASPVVIHQPAPAPLYTAIAPPPVSSRVPRTASAGASPSSWIPAAAPNHWTWIIIHHSDSSFGSAALIDRWHRDRGFDELGYHFVIGNGTNSGDGQVEVGPRWTKQKWGAHDNALDNRYNKQGIGICLVGDFDKQHPTAAQRKSLIRLVSYLMRTYHVSPDHILGHGDTKDTNCPGRNLHVAEIRQAVMQGVAEDDATPPTSDVAAVK